MKSNPPERRVVVEIKIGADSDEEVERTLGHIHYDWSRGTRGTISGSPAAGYTVTVKTNEDMTHEKYIVELKEYLGNPEE